MCAHQLKRPDDDRFLKKPTRLAGTPEIIQAACKTCSGNHTHAPVMGAMKVKGKWMKVSEFAGGYTRSFSTKVLEGAEKFLRKRREGTKFESFVGIPEERFTAQEEEAEEEQIDDIEAELERNFEREAEEGRGKAEERESEAEEEEEEQRKEKAEDVDKVMKLHRRLGHPAPENLTRMLRLAGVKKKYVEISKKLLCPTCNDMRAPDRPRAVRSNMRPTTFNEVLHVDLKYAKDVKKQLYVALSMVDGATNYHQAVLLKNREPEKVARALVDKWLSLFGPPKEIYMDQGGEFETAFVAVLEDHGILSHVTGAYAPWQNAFAERHGGLLAMGWSSLIYEYKVDSRKGMKMTLHCAVQAKNQLVTRRGYSAETLAFGRQSNFPDLLDDDTQDSSTLAQALCIESQVAKEAEMRAAAKRALLHREAQKKLKDALRKKPGNQTREYLPGQKVYFWVPGPKTVRYKRDAGVWRGPALIVAKESMQRYFISWRGRCLLVAATNLRPGSEEEAEDARGTVEELEAMEREMKTRGEVEEIEVRRDEDDQDQEEKWQTEGEVMRIGKKGRTKQEVKKMMRGLKAMKNVLKEPRMTRTNKKRRPKEKEGRKEEREAERTEERIPEEEVHEEGPPEVEMPDQVDDYSPEPAEEIEEDIEEFWRRVREQEESYVREDNRRQRRAEARRRSLLDDVPMSIKRKPEEQEGLQDLDVRKKFQKSFFIYVQNLVMEDEILSALAQKTGRKLKRVERKNEWLKGEEVQKLSELLELPITAVRLHKQPRKKMQSPGGKEGRTRITVMLLEKPGEAVVCHERADQVKMKPKASTPMKWRGMTLFVREEEKTKKEDCAYIQIGEKVYKAEVPDGEVWRSFVRREKDLENGAEALLLKLKASGKELDPRHFDEVEKEAYRKSDIKEWQSWVDNQVLERLSPQEAAKVPKDQIFKAPLRMLRVNKGKSAEDLQAKSRLIIPGHLDPELGGYRTDSPTTMPVAVRLLKSLIVTKGWTAWVFDVSTAFLSGKHTQRVVYIRAPPEGLPEVKGMKAVAPHELLRIVKGAYGLAEAPRLWYLRAVELLEKAGMTELTFCRSTFILKDSDGEVQAICCMHVDDGFLAGNPKSPAYQQLLKKVDASFSIKEWKKVETAPVTYLGMEMTYENGIFTDDMKEYVLKIPCAHNWCHWFA